MLVVILPFTQSIAPRIHGSRRFLFGASVQPSELAKLAVVVWTAMLVVRKGDAIRGLTKGVLPFIVVIGALDVLAAVEPDLSTAMLYTLLMAIVLFAGGVRIGHFCCLACWRSRCFGTRPNGSITSCCGRFRSSIPARPAEVGYQLKQSLIAVGSGGLFGVGFGQGRQQYGFLPFPFNDFVASNIGEEWGFLGSSRAGRGVCVLRLAGVPDRPRGAVAVSAAARDRADGHHVHHRISAHRRGDRPAADHRA